MKLFAALLVLSVPCAAQQVGRYQAEVHPSLEIKECLEGGCERKSSVRIVLDHNWRWLHRTDSSQNCYTGNAWDNNVCSDGKKCAERCALDGADYSKTYGITTRGSEVRLNYFTRPNVGVRVYVLNTSDMYYMFQLLNREFSVDVDVSQLPCGLNGALYLVKMDADGGMAQSGGRNTAGASYGTGYCDAQCPRDIKFINGEANVYNWTAHGQDSGLGKYGSCCSEMDIIEANSISNAYTSHPCASNGLNSCEGGKCSKQCDQAGCDLNPYRVGVKDFYGPGTNFKIDTTKVFTVSTKFITHNMQDDGDLVEIQRVYIQNGKSFTFPEFELNGKKFSSITEEMCKNSKVEFKDPDVHSAMGGLKKMGEAMRDGMVLAMSVWSDDLAQCLWLDSVYPRNANPNQPGATRGTCPTTSGVTSDLIANSPEAYVKFSNIRVSHLSKEERPVLGVSASSNGGPMNFGFDFFQK